MERLALRAGLPAIVDESHRQRAFHQRGGFEFTFGTQFLSILDAYRYVERSIKYGVLFLVLVLQRSFCSK
jgi:inner membrane protein involved in colicin E2 resistance